MLDEQLQSVATPIDQDQVVNADPVENLATGETLEEQLAAERKARLEVEEKNKKLYARAKQAEAEKNELKQQGGAQQYATVEDMDRTYLAARGYTDEEITSLNIVAKGTGKRLRDAATLPEANAIITSMRSKTKTQAATPSPSRHVNVQPGEKSWATMTDAERRANYMNEVAKIPRRNK